MEKMLEKFAILKNALSYLSCCSCQCSERRFGSWSALRKTKKTLSSLLSCQMAQDVVTSTEPAIAISFGRVARSYIFSNQKYQFG
jgi:hypothetical protein